MSREKKQFAVGGKNWQQRIPEPSNKGLEIQKSKFKIQNNSP